MFDCNDKQSEERKHRAESECVNKATGNETVKESAIYLF